MARPTSIKERFTITISLDGVEVQRPLAEMTAAEVLAAMAWHTSEAERLEREAAPARPVAEAFIETGAVPEGVTLETVRHYSGLLQRAQVANQRLERLLMLIRIVGPNRRLARLRSNCRLSHSLAPPRSCCSPTGSDKEKTNGTILKHPYRWPADRNSGAGFRTTRPSL